MKTLREMIRRALTKRTWVKKGRRRELKLEEIPPSERLVFFMQFTMVSIGALTALEITHLVMLGRWSGEIFAAITGLIGTIMGLFIGNRA